MKTPISYPNRQPRKQSSWGQHGAHLGPVGPRWAPRWPHESCYQGSCGVSLASNLEKIDEVIKALHSVHCNSMYVMPSKHYTLLIIPTNQCPPLYIWRTPLHCVCHACFITHYTWQKGFIKPHGIYLPTDNHHSLRRGDLILRQQMHRKSKGSGTHYSAVLL